MNHYLLFAESGEAKARLWLERNSEEREIALIIEPEQAELLLDFLHYKGAKPNEAAAKEWKKHKIILDFGNTMYEAQSGRSPLSEQQQETLFADMEAKLLELEK